MEILFNNPKTILGVLLIVINYPLGWFSIIYFNKESQKNQ
jgi:hypothetical protein